MELPYVEYQNEGDDDRIRTGFEQLRALLPNQPARYLTDAPSMSMAWALRKAGEPLLHGLQTPRPDDTICRLNEVVLPGAKHGR